MTMNTSHVAVFVFGEHDAKLIEYHFKSIGGHESLDRRRRSQGWPVHGVMQAALERIVPSYRSPALLKVSSFPHVTPAPPPVRQGRHVSERKGGLGRNEMTGWHGDRASTFAW